MESLLYRFGVQTALECNIFDLWLSRYPFGGDLASQYPNNEVFQLKAKQQFVRNLSLGKDDDHVMAGIVGFYLGRDPKCREKMVEYKLWDRIITDNSDGEDNDGAIHSSNERLTNQNFETLNPGLGPTMRGGRLREESPEEQMLRRRRREAMVLGEMGRPIASGDIIQPVNT